MPETRRCASARLPRLCRLSPEKGGVAIAKSVPDVINCSLARTRTISQLVDLALREIPVALRPAGMPAGGSAMLVEFLKHLREGFDAAGIRPRTLELTIDAAEVPPDAALFLTRHGLGAGTLNVLADRPSFGRWHGWLWRTRLEPARRVAVWPLTRSACPLLAAEAATDVLPGTGLAVPEQSAWVVVRLSLDGYVAVDGRLDRDALGQHLADAVAAADRVHDLGDWPTPAMQQDAWLNRRIAVQVDGIGDLVQALGLAAGEHATLRELDELMTWIRARLVLVSRELAAAGETLPAIAAGSPCRDGRAGADWQQRWLAAVKACATRHRNLLAISPWAMFPRKAADLAHADLLPLMRHADVCAVDGRPSLAAWNGRQYTDFHARVRAISSALCTGYVVEEPA
ncbi:MAG TPA: hypothetical protein VFY03_06655 [Woeseiaceae bacterium]|nr:hypothetical protein [Woeseiaceae bacterium]